jgi:hypothetical protein
VRITDRRALTGFWATKPNLSTGSDLPDGFDEDAIDAITGSTWQRTQDLAI